MDAIYLTLLPILGLVAYPNWKGVLRLSFALSLLTWEVIALSKAFQDPIVGLGFGMLSFFGHWGYTHKFLETSSYLVKTKFSSIGYPVSTIITTGKTPQLSLVLMLQVVRW